MESDLVLDGTKERALELLGAGLPAVTVAQSCGVSESYISQLLSDPEFLSLVVDKKFQALQKHNKRDDKYDELEDKVLKQLESQLSMIFDPMKLAKVLQVLNGAKRRGATNPDIASPTSQVVQLILPTVIMERFAVKKTVDNQIIEAGEQKLITMQSGTLMEKIRSRNQNGESNENPQLVGTVPS